jgi:hypothetical protein
MFLEKVSPQVRRELVRQRMVAMRGGLEQADLALRQQLTQQASPDNDVDFVALAMTRAELFQLDNRIEPALEQFNVLIRPRLDRLNLEIRLVVEQNDIELRSDPHGPDAASAVSDFYHHYDRKRMADVEWGDNLNLAIAIEAIDDDHHREAMSALWYESIRTFRLGCWGVHRTAMRRLGQEWLRIGESVEAVYCAILSRDDKLIGAVADDLLKRRDSALIEHVIAKVLSIANLQRHFCTACELLARIGDAIADERLGDVAEWLLLRSSIQHDSRGTGGPVHRSWRALHPIAHRLSIDLARRTIAAAVTHVAWTGENTCWVAREQIIKTVNQLVPVLPIVELETLAHQVLPLAADRMRDIDFGAVVNLLCHIAELGGDSVRGLIGDRLFAMGRPRYHILGQVAHVFRREYLPTDGLQQLSGEVARNVRLQVQRNPLDQPPEPVSGTLMQITRRTDSQTIITSVVSMIDWTAAAMYRQQLSPEGRREMALAATELIADSENDFGNRILLIQGLIDLGDVLDGQTIERCFGVIERVARGEIESTSEWKNNPLGPIKLRSMSKDDLRGIAIVGAAVLGSQQAELYRDRVENLLEEAFAAPQVEVRRGAFAAYGRFPIRSEGPLLAVLLGTRDPDPVGAITAFAALAEKQDLELNRNHWRLLLYSVRLASCSISSNLRRHAAAALARLIANAPRGVIHKHAEEILDSFKNDICESVRNATR